MHTRTPRYTDQGDRHDANGAKRPQNTARPLALHIRDRSAASPSIWCPARDRVATSEATEHTNARVCSVRNGSDDDDDDDSQTRQQAYY